jgi:hypothetical protein
MEFCPHNVSVHWLRRKITRELRRDFLIDVG